MATASLLKSDEKGFVIMLTPYDHDFVEVFKEAIPYPHRKWNPEKKVWLVAETMLDKIVPIMQMFFDDITENLTQEQQIDNIWEEVLKNIPEAYLDKVYIALCNGLHPDHGGSEEQMKLLNVAYQARKERK